MNSKLFVVTIFMLVVVSGCSTVSTSNVIVPVTEAPWDGVVLVSQASIPAGVEYKVIGNVQAKARSGYDRAASLYPLLANEAKKIGANAVINTKGGRRMTAFSWSAAYVNGTAVKVEDIEKLKGIPGSYY